MNGNDERRPLANPFSAMAVATVANSGDNSADITVMTDPIVRAVDLMKTYLHSQPVRPGQWPDGNVILVLGERGTGKTHLARRMIEVAAGELSDPQQSLHFEASAESLAKTYGRFVTKLTFDRIKARVNDYYADIVALQLQEKTITTSVAQALRAGAQTPGDMVAALGLMETALLRELQQTLRKVTDNDDFARALALLQRPGFDKAVRSWLHGADPSDVLVDRGITSAIATDTDLFEAMGVLALLFGGHRRRFVLVIDEFDKILELAQRTDESVLGAFQKMLEVFTKAGACLVLCGHPDFAETLNQAATERITHVIRLAGLTTAEATEFIRLALAGEDEPGELAPFTPDIIDYLVALTDGNARKVIRTCHQLFQASWANNASLITLEMVRAAIREQLGSLGAREVAAKVALVLDANGWPFRRDHQVGRDPRSAADFWLASGDTGCAVVIWESVLTSDDLAAITARAAAIRTAVSSARIVLLVSGVLDPELAIDLRTPLRSEPLVYNEHDFGKDFRALLTDVADWLPSPSSSPRQGVSQLVHQQANIHRAVEQLTSVVDDSRLATDRRLLLIERLLGALGSAQEGVEDLPRLPGQVERRFVAAFGALDEITQFAAMFHEAIADGRDDALRAVQRRLAMPKFAQAAGAAALMLDAVRAFEKAIRSWYLPHETDPSASELSANDAEDLDDICRSYDTAMEYLPLFTLDPLIELTPWAQRTSRLDDFTISARRERVVDALDNLSVRVRDAVVSSLPSVER